jgi:CBS domain-containing protein
MVSDPLTLDVSASAQEAGLRLSDPVVRAVLVCNGGALAGVVTRKTLVREVVAAGRSPSETRLGEIAEPPIFTLDADQDLDDAFRELEERDLERVPVTEQGRLVGILSRAVVRRRLAEDEPPVEEGH